LSDRLRHSPEGYIRTLQVSQARLFVFVEGAADRFFYSKLVERVCDTNGIEYEVRLARELPVPTGGKFGLLTFFDMLSAGGALAGSFGGKAWVCAFNVDKDLDDISGSMRRSSHIIYTEYYHVENYFFLHGDLARILQVAGKLPARTAQAIAHDGWQAKAAQILREWVVLCVASVLSTARCNINYRSFSRIHVGPPWLCNQRAFDDHKDVLRGSLSADTFEGVWDHAERVVAGLYSSGRQDSVFKGRWYANYLLAEVKAAEPAARDVSIDAILAGAQETLDFDGIWTAPLREAVARLVESLI
jgi:hypothetical protein